MIQDACPYSLIGIFRSEMIVASTGTTNVWSNPPTKTPTPSAITNAHGPRRRAWVVSGEESVAVPARTRSGSLLTTDHSRPTHELGSSISTFSSNLERSTLRTMLGGSLGPSGP